MSEWIRVKDRLPRYNTPVLVYRRGMASKILVDEYQGYYGEDDDEWYEGWALWGYYNGKEVITHWMPLPEPPKK